MPFFSVIVPTTRSRLLKYSVRSVLDQTFGDFEVVVSDNASAGVAEALRDLAGGDERRLRYVRTPSRLAINDSWQFALDQAGGDWVILLADDDVMTPHLLEEVRQAIALHPDAEVVSYGFSSYSEEDAAGVTAGYSGISPYSGRTERFSSADVLRSLMQLGGTPAEFGKLKRRLPSIMFSAYKAELIRRVTAAAGRLFVPWIPDYAALALAMAFTRELCKIDKPLLVLNNTRDSNGAGASGDMTVLRRMLDEYPEPPFQFVPFKGCVVSQNIIADTLLNVRRLLPEVAAAYPWNWTAYFTLLLDAQYESERQGGKVAQERADLLRVLENQPDEVRRAVQDWLAARPRRAAPAAVQAPPPLRARVREGLKAFAARHDSLFRAQLAETARTRGFAVRSRAAGFRDILDFARFLDRLLVAAEAG